MNLATIGIIIGIIANVLKIVGAIADWFKKMPRRVK